ncbi:LacI family DNA-binding transcriptional regulator [Paenibacillus sp. GYB003]|uniref:LacI family DNA-binding transcriptional regulator n=1 Tax=Paenibacillus sp. GYB003 TaxID=2994392 RepID=UPI002F966E95
MVTIKDIARAAGVTHSTVSRALNNEAGVSEKMRQKIADIARQMNYVPNVAAKRLIRKKTNYIGLIWPRMEGLFFYNLSLALHKEGKKRGYDVIMTMADPVEALRSFNQLMVDYVVYWTGFIDWVPSFDFIKEAERFDGKMILLGGGKMEGAHSIEINRRGGIYEAVRYLAELGHRSIGFVGYPSLDKFNGYMQGITEFGLNYRPDFIVNSTESSKEQAFEAFIDKSDRPSALVVDCQGTLVWLNRLLKRHRLHIPDDMSLIVYDDVPEMEMFDIPPTTVGPSIDRLVDRSLELLLPGAATERADGDEDGAWTHETMEPTLTVRQSTREIHNG